MTGLLIRLADRGLSVTVDGGNLTVRPKTELTDDLRAELRTHKAALVGYLTAQTDRLPLTLFSRRLGDTLILAPDSETRTTIDGHPVYTLSETQRLRGASTEMLMAVHEGKKSLGGRVVKVSETSNREELQQC
ncbi:MAG: hypothetical protein AUJ92_11620 [Armatimonadetes bacterium CG2_30_59_28]|nr:hypothetical protein [Armatimonadota bacterium]OIO93750.1 MAG: hypothetical protein AUJ92_11620 [Armatimonadetes bacterium CG2_30_59_28]PIU67473.1 MAG: hypothetical protein COS85_00525 [Armatimonadetes bacterium CG07_land_8_20_14_0_80_59_28]PIX40818.1 MAG: hypothetical protein COZ56_13700 [Armatimonadetes bacterium CG_4_8_14_3_um_filter_58_9]PIY43132.1 MAG: hypothetical protein COZ05_12010 [Armatimonadetes bacterium CG_4_10_14_3_um_filter_59_10]PJB63212.1 MAG: hypothetical protein CO095_169